MTFTAFDPQVEGNSLLPSASCLLPSPRDLAPHYEIDSAEDGDFGTLYRLWKSYIFLGSFYQNLSGKWIAQPANSDTRAECDTEYQAQLVILAIQGLVVPAAA
ncbi:WGR domain-containing protein [Nostoc sp. DSM 114161]|uniref:hypothetical protein n=1 Tax=Nostoc sp. DSM 114161 TaxID=3440143 RepID=UPI0040460382